MPKVGVFEPLRTTLLPANVPERQRLRDLTQTSLLQQFGATGALINSQGDVLYLEGRSGSFLEPTSGPHGVNNIFKMARPGLKPALATVLHKAMRSKLTTSTDHVRVKTNGHYALVQVTVHPQFTPSQEQDVELFVVVLQIQSSVERSTKKKKPSRESTDSLHAQIDALTEQLSDRDIYIQSAREELESTTEELKSANEEMQSVNEELQSTNEELETSKEELQSVNEELATVNTELQARVNDMSCANNDLSNFLGGTGVATVFIDHQLNILRFTPAAREIVNLIPGDIGRPIAHLVSNLINYGSLATDAQKVLDSLVPKETEVESKNGQTYLLRIKPYRTVENVIEGAVIFFINITELKKTRDALLKANDLLRLAVVVRDAHDAITVQSLDGTILAWNPGAERMYGWTESEALAMNVHDRIPIDMQKQELARLVLLSQAELLEPSLTQRLTKGGQTVDVSIISTALFDGAGKMYAVATTERLMRGGKFEQ